MPQRRPREIHYELAPRAPRRPVSIYRILFALIVGICILAAILLALYIVWYAYVRSNGRSAAVNYRRGEALPEKPIVTARPVTQHRKHFEIIVAHSDNNTERAQNVASYLNKSLGSLIDRNVYSDFNVSKESSRVIQRVNKNDGRMTLVVQLHRAFPVSSTVVIVSEQFPPTGEQIWKMVRSEQRFCSFLDKDRCVELCTVVLKVDDVPNITPGDTDYEVLDVRIPDLVDYVQNSAIYRQSNKEMFTLARFKKGCSTPFY